MPSHKRTGKRPRGEYLPRNYPREAVRRSRTITQNHRKSAQYRRVEVESSDEYFSEEDSAFLSPDETWSSDLEDMARELIDRADHEAWVYGQMVLTAQKWSDWLVTVPAIITGAVGVEGVVTTSDGETPLWLGVIATIFAFTAASMLAVNNVWKPGEVSAKALKTQVQLLNIKRRLWLQMVLSSSEREKGKEFMEKVFDDYDSAMLGAPVPYESVLRKGEWKYGARLQEKNLGKSYRQRLVDRNLRYGDASQHDLLQGGRRLVVSALRRAVPSPVRSAVDSLHREVWYDVVEDSGSDVEAGQRYSSTSSIETLAAYSDVGSYQRPARESDLTVEEPQFYSEPDDDRVETRVRSFESKKPENFDAESSPQATRSERPYPSLIAESDCVPPDVVEHYESRGICMESEPDSSPGVALSIPRRQKRRSERRRQRRSKGFAEVVEVDLDIVRAAQTAVSRSPVPLQSGMTPEDIRQALTNLDLKDV